MLQQPPNGSPEAMIIGEALSIPLVGFICQPDHKIEEDAARSSGGEKCTDSFTHRALRSSFGRSGGTRPPQSINSWSRRERQGRRMCSHVCLCVCARVNLPGALGVSRSLKAMNSEGFNAALMSVMQNLGLITFCVL